ncbi:NAD(P)/FAD-dependent oxidoreductase [Aedoeadaptatus acetigenes]|uniref:NAD(P)/FAD-dependent oxidoreductase n=1 Tax=Aedoeadaptatus acetigenes TaxID=2981723 RepID=UPI0011DCB9EE|nr:FAD-dependent oxidoreductase [Aedoeadaptatus acetigenes]MCU6787249.1 FAD-dependent oxidoreductase [Aedoeadaptatus acetigenes]
MKTYNYLIVGAGIAGVTAAKEIRKHDKEGSILLLGNEKVRPYFRIQLTALLGDDAPEIPYLDKEGWEEKLALDVKLGAEVVSVDFDAMTVTLAGGEKIQGEKILLANGSHSSVPPFKNNELKGIFTLRNWDDLMTIQNYIKGFKETKHIAVIGGGLLGLEAANSLKKSGHVVAIINRSEYLLSKQLDRELGMMLNEEMKDLGFMVFTEKSTKAFIGEDEVRGIEFDDGTAADFDMVLISAGVRPNTELFKDTGLEVNKGVIVDSHLMTNKANVWAAGDVAEVEGRVMGIWPASRAMGKVAGANMAGGDGTYENPKAHTKLDLDTIQIFSAGKIGEGDVYFYDDGDIHHRLYATDGKVTGAVLYGDTSAMGTFRKLVEAHAPIEEALDGAYPFKSEKE